MNEQSVQPPESKPALPVAQGAGSRRTPGQVVVSVRNVTKIFKDFWGKPKARAVDNVSFEVYRGEIFGILGPNGSGKTTLLKMILGLLHPTKGVIEVLGKHPRDVQTKSRIGYLPEESYLYRYLDSRETLDFFGRLFSLPRTERTRRTEQLLEMVGLANVRTRAVGEFSKGMQRRIGLAQALINDPDLVILDEPTSGLDPIGCREMKDLILALAKRGKTIILSSHLLADVEDLCDRVMILYGGRIHALGTLQDLLTRRDTIRITVPVPPAETLETVVNTLKRTLPADRIRIDNPQQNLESFFMEVVQRAMQSAAETSGATAGHRLAEYLVGTDQQVSVADRLLARLAASEPARPAQTPEQPPQTAPSVNLEMLEALTKPEPAPKPAPGPTEPAAPQVDLSQADARLRSLTEPDPDRQDRT